MEIICSKEDLQQALSRVKSVVKSRTTLPILENVLIRTKNDNVEISATNLQIGMETRMEGNIIEAGSICLPARKLLDLINSFTPDEIKISVKENKAIISSGTGKYTLLGLDAVDFPAIPEMPGIIFALNAKKFSTMISAIAFAASTDESRYNLNGIYLHFTPEKTCLVATDGKVLALVEGESIDNEFTALIPSNAIPVILNLQEEIIVGQKDNNLVFSDSISRVSILLIEEEFPAYEKIIPTENDMDVVLNTESFLSAIRRVSLLADIKVQRIKLDFSEGSLIITSASPTGEAKEEINIKCNNSLSIAFNASYLKNILSHISVEEITLSLKEPLTAGILYGENSLYVLMPMRRDNEYRD